SAFGRPVAEWGPLAPVNRTQFSSMPFHGPSGGVLYLRRPYFPDLQRCGTPDPTGEAGGLNLYGFAGNNPFSNFDAFGLSWYDWLNPFSYSSFYAQWQGRQDLDAEARHLGYKDYEDALD